MLNTLYQIGRELSDIGRDPWEDILDKPKLNKDKTAYLLPIHFNIDTLEVSVDATDLRQYSTALDFGKKWCNIKIQGGNNKACYLTCPATKPEQLYKTLFGKPLESGKAAATKGELIEAFEKEKYILPETSILLGVLDQLFKCKDNFINLMVKKKKDSNEPADADKLQLDVKNQSVTELIKLGINDEIALISIIVSSEALGLDKVFLGDLEGYRAFIEAKFLSSKHTEGKESTAQLCYITGDTRNDIVGANFGERYNINKAFVQETKNYASQFDDNNYSKNYQLSTEALLYIERGSSFLLSKAVVDIAGSKFVFIPEFIGQKSINVQEFPNLSKKLNLLFSSTLWSEVYTYLEDNAEFQDGLYWLTLLGIDSNGNYFKASSFIKDVSNLYLSELFSAQVKVGERYSPWLGDKYSFNLYMAYRAIPVRSDKGKVNKAMSLIQAILEQREIDKNQLFQHFKELVLCHYYRRYRAYSNIRESPKDGLRFALRDSVFTYLALFELLAQMNLLPDTTKIIDMEQKSVSYKESIDDFFKQMNFSEPEKAMFYLGRVLNVIVWKQSEKQHKKTALDKLNYNGMDSEAIYRFATELFESSRHYDATRSIEWDWGRFSKGFKPDLWEMDKSAALFYILCGYTYKMQNSSKPDTNNEDNI